MWLFLVLRSGWPLPRAGSFKINICSPVDTDEVEKSPDERNEEQRAFRSTFCPPSAESHEMQRVLESDPQGDCVCVCSFIQWSVICVASQRGLTNISIGRLSMALCCLAPHLSATGQCVCVCVCAPKIGGFRWSESHGGGWHRGTAVCEWVYVCMDWGGDLSRSWRQEDR